MDESDMKSMKNILLSCQEKQDDPLQFKEYQIHRAGSSHPLNNLIEDKAWPIPYLLVSKPMHATEPVSPHTPVKHDTQNGYHEEESFEGSPLKLQEFRLESFISCPIYSEHIDSDPMKVVKPLNIGDARSLLSVYNLCTVGQPGDNNNCSDKESTCDDETCALPMWVMCDGRDPEHNILLGSTVSKDKDGNSKIMLTNVTVQGQMCKDSTVMRHLWAKRPSFCRNGKNLTTKCFAKYNLFGGESHGVRSEHQRALEVHFHWNKLTSLLQAPPAESKTLVKATVVVGDTQSAAHPMFTELCTLKRLVEGIECGCVEWSVEQDDRPIITRVHNLVTDSEAGMTCVESKDDHQKDCNKANDTAFIKTAQNLLITQRDELDFTEELWLILKDCTSLQELIDCIQFVLKNLESGDLQPVLHRHNKTSVGQLIRDSYYSKLTSQSLEGTEPLEMLVDMGIQKMSNDYVQIFSELVTMDSVDRLISDKGTLSERLVGLEKLHYTLELIVMLETLNLPQIILRIAARQALKYYETNAVSKKHTFTIPVQTLSVQAAVDRLELDMWQANLTTTKADTEVRVMYMFTEKAPFDHVKISQPDSTLVLHEDSKPYYLTCLTEDVMFL